MDDCPLDFTIRFLWLCSRPNPIHIKEAGHSGDQGFYTFNDSLAP